MLSLEFGKRAFTTWGLSFNRKKTQALVTCNWENAHFANFFFSIVSEEGKDVFKRSLMKAEGSDNQEVHCLPAFRR